MRVPPFLKRDIETSKESLKIAMNSIKCLCNRLYVLGMSYIREAREMHKAVCADRSLLRH